MLGLHSSTAQWSFDKANINVTCDDSAKIRRPVLGDHFRGCFPPLLDRGTPGRGAPSGPPVFDDTQLQTSFPSHLPRSKSLCLGSDHSPKKAGTRDRQDELPSGVSIPASCKRMVFEGHDGRPAS